MTAARLVGRAKRLPKIEQHADADAGVGDVEAGIGITAEVQVDKINHVAVAEAVDHIAHDAAAQQAEADLAFSFLQTERAAPEEDRAQGHQRKHVEQ